MRTRWAVVSTSLLLLAVCTTRAQEPAPRCSVEFEVEISRTAAQWANGTGYMGGSPIFAHLCQSGISEAEARESLRRWSIELEDQLNPDAEIRPPVPAFSEFWTALVEQGRRLRTRIAARHLESWVTERMATPAHRGIPVTDLATCDRGGRHEPPSPGIPSEIPGVSGLSEILAWTGDPTWTFLPGMSSDAVPTGTTTSANWGMVSHAARRVDADPAFARSVFEFYSRFPTGDFGLVPHPIDAIGRDDWWAAALEQAAGDPRSAMDLLAVYGHDDYAHTLDMGGVFSCRALAIDRIAPAAPSSLYAPGALGGLTYPSSWVNRGLSIQQACQDAYPTPEGYSGLCGDDRRVLADYYHVTASAVIGCRLAGVETEPGLSAIAGAYLLAPIEYKIARFHESNEESIKNASDSPTAQALTEHFGRIVSHFHSVDTVTRVVARQDIAEPPASSYEITEAEALAAGLTPLQRQRLNAILNHEAFSIWLRYMQHRMGLEWGMRQCAGHPVHSRDPDHTESPPTTSSSRRHRDDEEGAAAATMVSPRAGHVD